MLLEHRPVYKHLQETGMATIPHWFQSILRRILQQILLHAPVLYDSFYSFLSPFFLLLKPSVHRSGSGRYAVTKMAGDVEPRGMPQTA